MSRAALETNNIERMKHIITATISNFILANKFLKPLNPYLGETIEAFYSDGT